MIHAKLEYAPVINALRRAAAEMANTRPLMGAVAHIMTRAVEVLAPVHIRCYLPVRMRF